MLLVDVPIQGRRIAVRRAAEVAQQPRLSGRRRVGDALVLHQRELAREVLVAGVAREPVEHRQLQVFWKTL